MNSPISVVFFGTYHFASTILQTLIDDPAITVDLVITQPDKPVGRKKVLTPPPVKVLAQEHGIEVLQPASLKKFDRDLSTFTVGITAQYGKLIPEYVLNGPNKGILNVHTSLLPKYRGASPIQSALINGEEQTGVTIMQMGVGLDTGPILLQKSLDIAPDDTYLDLDAKLADIGAQALLEAVGPYITGELAPVEQDDSQATHCSLFSREDGRIDWQKSSAEIYNQYRGLTPWPGIWAMWNDKRLKLLNIRPATQTIPAGTVMIEDGKLFIGTTDASIEVHELQLEGKQRMDVATFLQGYSNINGEILS